MSEIDFNKIEVGQWIWTQQQARWTTNDKFIREVTRKTKTHIVCDDGDEFDRFRISNGRGFSHYIRNTRIVGIATPEEIETIGIPQKNSRLAEKERRRKCEDMQHILPEGMKAWTMDSVNWNVRFEIDGLSEDRVRQIAAFLNQKETR